MSPDAALQRSVPPRWGLDNPLVWEQIGRSHLLNPAGPELGKAEAAFLQAARGSPMESKIWTGLADTYLQMARFDQVETALRTALRVSPHEPANAWRLGNALVLAGRVQEALPLLRVVALSDPEQRLAIYDLGWKLLESANLVSRDIVPDDLDAKAAYLTYLIQRRPKNATATVWQDLRRAQHPDTIPLGYALVDALVATEREKEATDLWNDVLESTGRGGARPAGALMTNGDFEFDLPDAGLDWHLVKGRSWTFKLDNFIACHGSRSLMISFEGQSNPQFNNLWQLVIVEPSQDYLLRACVRTDNLTSDCGFQIMADAYRVPPSESFTVTGPVHVGSETWIEDKIRFHTGPHTRMVRVWLYRAASHKLYGQLSGRVWVDNFRIERSAGSPPVRNQ